MNYEVKIIETSKTLSAKEKIMLKDTTNAVPLDEATKNGKLVITPAYYVTLAIHNEHSKDTVDYNKYIIVDTEGVKYATGSNSLISSFVDIYEEMQNEDEPYQIEIYRVPSKNHKGKEFITCSII